MRAEMETTGKKSDRKDKWDRYSKHLHSLFLRLVSYISYITMWLAIERQVDHRLIALYILRHGGIIKSSCICPSTVCVCVCKESCSSKLTRKRGKIWGERERESNRSNVAREIEQAQNSEREMCIIYIYIPGTQMTLVLIWKGLLLKGSTPKTKDR